MTAAGKITAAALAARVAAGEPVRVLLVRTESGQLAPATRKTGVETLTVTESGWVRRGGYGRTYREYQFTTSQGETVWVAPIQTFILAPEDAAAVKRAEREAYAMKAEEDAASDARYRAAVDRDFRASGALDDAHAEALVEVIGQCWASHTTADKTPQVFVSPVLSDAGQVLETLTHELIHAWDDCKSGHRGDFAKLAKRVGLEGKMTATHAGDALKARLDEIAAQLGDYPHARLSTGDRDGQGEKKQTTRMIKCECDACGYTARTTRKWLDEVGAPLCACNREPMTVHA